MKWNFVLFLEQSHIVRNLKLILDFICRINGWKIARKLLLLHFEIWKKRNTFNTQCLSKEFLMRIGGNEILLKWISVQSFLHSIWKFQLKVGALNWVFSEKKLNWVIYIPWCDFSHIGLHLFWIKTWIYFKFSLRLNDISLVDAHLILINSSEMYFYRVQNDRKQ